MQNGQILNLGPRPGDNEPQESAQIPNELSRLEEQVEQARSDIKRTRLLIDKQQADHESQVRRTRTLSIVLAVLTLGLIGSSWFAYTVVEGQGAAVGELLRVKNVVGAVGERLDSAEARIKNSTVALPRLVDRMEQIQATVNSNLQAAQKQAQSAASQVGREIRADFNRTVQGIQSRIAGLESNQHEASGRVTQLQEEIAGLRREIASMREQAAAYKDGMTLLQDTVENSSNELSSLDRRMASSQTTIDALATQVERKRIDFQLPRNRTHEIAPGIHLTVKRANVGKQQIDGSLKILSDNRDLPIRAQMVQKPMVFYMQGDSRPIELILTAVSKNDVSGYLLMPAQSVQVGVTAIGVTAIKEPVRD